MRAAFISSTALDTLHCKCDWLNCESKADKSNWLFPFIKKEYVSSPPCLLIEKTVARSYSMYRKIIIHSKRKKKWQRNMCESIFENTKTFRTKSYKLWRVRTTAYSVKENFWIDWYGTSVFINMCTKAMSDQFNFLWHELNGLIHPHPHPHRLEDHCCIVKQCALDCTCTSLFIHFVFN